MCESRLYAGAGVPAGGGKLGENWHPREKGGERSGRESRALKSLTLPAFLKNDMGELRKQGTFPQMPLVFHQKALVFHSLPLWRVSFQRRMLASSPRYRGLPEQRPYKLIRTRLWKTRGRFPR